MGLRNPVLAGRAADLRDVGRRVLHLLIGREEAAFDLPQDAILVAEDLAPSDTAVVRSIAGARLLHDAWAAPPRTWRSWPGRWRFRPSRASIRERSTSHLDRASILDGDTGTAAARPDRRGRAAGCRTPGSRGDAPVGGARGGGGAGGHDRRSPRRGRRQHRRRRRSASACAELGGEGVGLLRSEFLFMDRRTAPERRRAVRELRGDRAGAGPRARRSSSARSTSAATSRCPTCRSRRRTTRFSASAASGWCSTAPSSFARSCARSCAPPRPARSA